MAKESIDILFPPGRLVQGSLYKPNTTDAENRPLVIKTGPNAGQPRVDYYLAVAIKKEPGHTHWANTEWGAKIWALAHKEWPNGQAQRPDFAWKITDGDSTIPNKQGKKPCEMTGHAGHWIVKFGGGTAPKIVNRDGSAAILEPDAVMPGDFVQVFGSVASNESTQTAGLYVNHRIVSFQGYDAVNGRISYGPDAAAVGFGQAPLPPGVSSVPLGGMTPSAAGAPPVPPGAPSAPTASPPVPTAGVPVNTPPVPSPTPPPNQQFVQNAAGATPPPPPGGVAPPPPATPARVMLPAAGGASYEQMIAAGWNDQTLVAHGMMAA